MGAGSKQSADCDDRSVFDAEVRTELQRLMRRHPGFSRDDLPGYLDLFSYIHNPPQDKYEKVENLIKRILENPNSLKYRD